MSLADSAKGILQRLGDPVTLTYETGEVRDPATGELITPASEVNVSGFGYPGDFRNSEIDGETIKQGDIRLTLNQVDTKPEIGWTATVVGRTYRVMDVRRVRYRQGDVIYVLQLRV